MNKDQSQTTQPEPDQMLLLQCRQSPRWAAEEIVRLRLEADIREPSTAQEMPEWQPIDTAPKDGTSIRVKRVYMGDVIYDGLACWRTVRFGALSADALGRDVGFPEVVETGWMYPLGVSEKRVPYPTHWKPISAAPGKPIRPTDNYLLAADRLRHYVAMRDEQPIHQSTDLIHAIHTGTRWEAELLLSDLRTLMDGSEVMS